MPDLRPPLSAACPHYSYRRRIGIMGGSFNPAHNGHLHSTALAKRAAQLDEVWWLVSPQNPLKSADEMASFSRRFASAQAVAIPHRWIKILDFEQRHGLSFTAHSLKKLASHCPRAEFVWIMGADNLIQFPHWHRASALAQLLPVLVINRPTYGYQSLASRGARLLGLKRRSPRRLSRKSGGWAFLHGASNPSSSTAIRRGYS